MKTIFGHALIEENYNAPIYNVMFDQTGSFVISGADDGIIKIWDKETMNLQASLHSHDDVITDIDMSKCNKYLATASKDGKLIIWDWKNCQKLDEIQAHNSTINNIKFLQVKLKSKNSQKKEVDNIQILVTGSDDGTIKIFDELNYLQSQIKQNNETNLRKSSRHHPQQTQQKPKERFQLCVTPEDYRPGPASKNKKIESINVNSNGIIAAGTNTGEVYLWKLDLIKFKQQHPKAYQWLGSSKKHTKTVHFCEFSPNGKYLFTGSVDGTAKIWNLELEKSKESDEIQLGLTDNRLIRFGVQINYGDHKAQKNNWQCDTIAWSCFGRYAICALSGKVDGRENQEKQEFSVLKVWDSYTNKIIQDLGKENNLQLLNFSFVIAPHPKIEEIFMSGSDGGTICLWNIKTRKLVKKFLEYGIYSYEKYTMNDPYDGKFSPDGSSFVVGSVMGTISLFSNNGSKFQYEATRVEQFYPQDDQKHLLNIYYDLEEEPQICGYSLIPYEAQPPSSYIGKFRNSRKMNNEEYERNLIIRQELSKEEEEFLQSQLEEGLRNNFFNNNDNIGPFDHQMNDLDNLAQFIEQQPEGQLRRNERERINSQISQISNSNNHNQGSYEELQALNRINEAENQVRRRGRGRRTNIAARVQQQQIRAINTNLDPDNSFYDRASDENFEVQESEISEKDSDLEYDDELSEEQKVITKQMKEANTRKNNFRSNDQQVNSRAERALRRQGLLNRNEEDDDEVRGKRSKRKRAVINSADSSQNDFSDDNDFQLSNNQDDDQPRRRLKRNNQSIESEDESDDSEKESEYGIRTRRARNEKKQQKLEQRNNQRVQQRNLRTRNHRKKYDGMDSSEEELDFNDYEEEKQKGNSQNDQKGTSQSRKQSRLIKEQESDEDMIDQDVIVPTDLNKKQQKGDEDFELIQQNLENQIQLDVEMIQNVAHKCEFCQRNDPPLLGPFLRVQKPSNSKAQLNEQCYFHKDCIEVNEFSFFSMQKQKWLNIGKALDYFRKFSSLCGRCLKNGATIKCSSCSKYYHGFLCSQLYMVFTDAGYQCFECRNYENYKQFKDKDQLIEKQELKLIKRNMPREHLLSAKQTLTSYVPQVQDLVYYFYQGHEKFISFYNCFFYAGDYDQIKFNYPWQLHIELEQPTLCRIIGLNNSFPTKNMLYLLKRFGKISQIVQAPQIITHLELQIVSQPQKKFQLDFFQNELPDFLVLKDIFEVSTRNFQRLLQEDQLIGKQFPARAKNFNQVQVIKVQEKEQSLDHQTNWENILYRHVDNYRFRERGRRGQRRDEEDQEQLQVETMNYWELDLNKEQDNYKIAVSGFNENEIQYILSNINDYIQRKKDQTSPFIDRVPEKIAPDYRQHVAAEMYLSLIQNRLINGYYRTQDQLFCDLDQIMINARIYNGEDHLLYKDAKKLADQLKSEIKRTINYQENSKKLHLIEEQKSFSNFQNMKPVGKLTAPIIKPEMNYTTTMEQFKQNLKRQQQQQHMFNQQPDLMIKENKKNKENENTYFNDQIKIDISDNSEQKITPNYKNQADFGQQKKQTRNQIQSTTRGLENGMIQEQYNTGEKISKKTNGVQEEAEEGFNVQLGKRITRSGRQTRQMKNTLNEEDSDKEFEKLINSKDDDKLIGQHPSRRIRQH